MYVPLALVVIYAFNASGTSAWPPSGLHAASGSQTAIANTGLRDAFLTSLAAALGATLDRARSSGTLASLAVPRYAFFGRETISFVVILPIALPGIVTGMALSTTFATLSAADFGHVHDRRRPRDVLHRARLQQRHRPAAAASAPSLEEASADLGADTLQTFRRITLPGMRTALLAGALLAFALSFDEIIVTNFTAGRRADAADLDLPELPAGRTRSPLVNVAGLVAILLSVIPVYIATRLTSDTGAAGRT